MPDAFYTPEQDKHGLQRDQALEAGLPNVLLIGDSISVGYTPVVRQLLTGVANVMRPDANCGDTRFGLANLDAWLGATHWGVIHFNFGLHDLCYRHPDAKVYGCRDKVSGTLAVGIDDYRDNLAKLVARLRQTGAKLIWASTTFVPPDEPGRFQGDDERYNAVAAEIMTEKHIVVNDLHTITRAMPASCFVGPGDVHYSQEGTERLGQQVAQTIRDILL